jgi:hypothetical protein
MGRPHRPDPWQHQGMDCSQSPTWQPSSSWDDGELEITAARRCPGASRRRCGLVWDGMEVLQVDRYDRRCETSGRNGAVRKGNVLLDTVGRGLCDAADR